MIPGSRIRLDRTNDFDKVVPHGRHALCWLDRTPEKVVNITCTVGTYAEGKKPTGGRFLLHLEAWRKHMSCDAQIQWVRLDARATGMQHHNFKTGSTKWKR